MSSVYDGGGETTAPDPPIGCELPDDYIALRDLPLKKKNKTHKHTSYCV